MKHVLAATAATAMAVLLATTAHAALDARATTDLNFRSGPGPQYPVVGVIAANDSTSVMGCLEGSKWCQISYNGKSGWAFGDYLATQEGQAQVVAQLPAARVPTVKFEGGTAAGAATGAIAGALVGGPIGAVVGGAIGAGAGAAIDNPPPTVRTYVTANRADPIYLDGEVVVGATVPPSVTLRTVPDYQYSYVYLNGQPVLVDPASRRIVYVYR